MLTELCQELKNWFERGKMFGTFTISEGQIDVPEGSLQDGQYFRIIGSVFNDGVHQYPADMLEDEVFEGAIWSMAVPPAVVDLSERILDWQNANGEMVSSPYASESFGGYAYTKASAGQGSADSGGGISWRTPFASELNKWRKL